MSPQRSLLRQPLGACGAHKVFLLHVEHRRARDARENRRLHHRQRNRRQEQGLQRGPEAAAGVFGPAGKATGRKPLQLHGEQQNQQNREPEVGNGDADLRQAHHAHIAQLVVARRRIDTRRDRDDGGEQHGDDGQRNGEGEALQHQIQDRRAVGVAGSHVAGEQSADPVEIALHRRLIQTQLIGQFRNRLGRRIRAEQHLGRVSGKDFQHCKHHDGSRRQSGQQREQSFEEEKSHGENEW